MFDKFHKDAHLAMASALEESAIQGHGSVACEHILVGLMNEGAGIAEIATSSVGLSRDKVRAEILKLCPTTYTYTFAEASFTPGAKTVLQLAWDESRKLGDGFIATEHLLLALLRESDGLANQVLKELGVDPRTLKTLVFQLIQQRKRGNDIDKIQLPMSSSQSPRPTPATRVHSDPEFLMKVVVKPDALEGFSEQSKQVLQQAAIEAATSDWPFIRAIHIVMGLFVHPDSTAVKALEECQVTLQKLQDYSKTVPGRGPGLISPEMDFMQDALSSLQVARTQAELRGKTKIEPEHILLGVAVSISLITQSAKLLDTLRLLMGERIKSEARDASTREPAYEMVTVESLTEPEYVPAVPRTQITDWFSKSAIEAMRIAMDEARQLAPHIGGSCHNPAGSDACPDHGLRTNSKIHGNHT